MHLKRLLALGTCLLASILLVFILCFFSSYRKLSNNKFIRLLPSHLAVPLNIIDLKSIGFYFAGERGDTILLGNYNLLDKLLKINQFNDSVTQWLPLPKSKKFYKGTFNIVRGTSVCTLDGNQSYLYLSRTDPTTSRGYDKVPFFSQAILSSKNDFVFRTIRNGQNILIKWNLDSLEKQNVEFTLEKQVDGIFCTDGNLIKVPNSNKVIYIYYYRNQFICLSNDLKLFYKGKTIDTVSKAKIKVAYIKSQDQTTLAAPPVYVNKQSTANENYLFIHSGLRADNEVEGTLDKLSVIDVYQVKDGKYKLSFYLPDFNGKKLTDFRVYGKHLYALFDHYLYKYQLNF